MQLSKLKLNFEQFKKKKKKETYSLSISETIDYERLDQLNARKSCF